MGEIPKIAIWSVNGKPEQTTLGGKPLDPLVAAKTLHDFATEQAYELARCREERDKLQRAVDENWY